MYQPYPSGQQAPEPARPQPPAPVAVAVMLMYAGAVVSLASLILSLATVGSLRASLHQARPDLSAAQLHTAEVAAVTVAVIVGLIGIGLWVWMAMANRAGKSWARITATVFFGLDTLFLVTGFTQPAAILTRLISILLWLIGLGAIVLLWLKESSDYFTAMTGPRSQ